MKNIFLSSDQVASDLLLTPTEDTLYVLPQDAQQISLTLELATSGVKAFVVGLFFTKNIRQIAIQQNHRVPGTDSHILLKSLVSSEGEFSYQGTILVTHDAPESNASQEVRGLLLGENACFKAVPSLEIHPKNVLCTHKASSTPLNKDSLQFLNTRGFKESEARIILENAFLKNASDTLQGWKVPEAVISQITDMLPVKS